MGDPVTKLIVGGVTSAQGFLAAGVHGGVKPQKKDIALVFSRVPAAAAGVFTTNKVKAAPVLVDMERIRSGRGQAVVLNAGNANACTGEQGLRDAREMALLAAQGLEISEELVYVCSTGVIGHPLPMDALRRGIPEAVKALGPDGAAAAEAIMTTDTVPKTAAVQIEIGGQVVTIGGMTKGAAMIHPADGHDARRADDRRDGRGPGAAGGAAAGGGPVVSSHHGRRRPEHQRYDAALRER